MPVSSLVVTATVTVAPPREVLPQGRSFYHPELDVLRFIAFFLVFLGHANYDLPLPTWSTSPFTTGLYLAVHGAGSAGVGLFFTLSSYLITELLLRERERTGTVHLGAFYIRRILRIWPLYLFFLLVVRPILGHYLPTEQFSPVFLMTFLLLVGNWECYRSGWPHSVAQPL